MTDVRTAARQEGYYAARQDLSDELARAMGIEPDRLPWAQLLAVAQSCAFAVSAVRDAVAAFPSDRERGG